MTRLTFYNEAWAGMLNAWAWREHTKILRNKQRIRK